MSEPYLDDHPDAPRRELPPCEWAGGHVWHYEHLRRFQIDRYRCINCGTVATEQEAHDDERRTA